jgi:hopene-associated glycosyltransferase HpnB
VVAGQLWRSQWLVGYEIVAAVAVVLGFMAVTIALLSLAIWIYLLVGRGQFWRVQPVILDRRLLIPPESLVWPKVAIVIPARNEAAMLPQTLEPLLQQDYPGIYQIYLVDDQSDDGTGAIAQELANANPGIPCQIMQSQPLPPGWTGKLWALHQGLAAATATDYVLLTDADICHDRASLRYLVLKAETEQRDLVSLMVRLRCESFWERLLIPAFVFFFAKLYPFSWVNRPDQTTAAAAGGCSLVRRSALDEIGGIAALKDALIDDCTLAAKIKHRDNPTNQHRIWLGLTTEIRSLRPYDDLASIWNMVARTAYTQLNYSPLLLLGTIVGMALVYLVALIGIIYSLFSQQWGLLGITIATYSLMVVSYRPAIQFYRCPGIYALALPLIGLMYNLMTIDSAWRHWQGKGGQWKGRSY